MTGKGWIMAIAIVAVLVTALILTGHVEQWTDSDLGDLWFPAFALIVIGVVVYWLSRKPPPNSGRS